VVNGRGARIRGKELTAVQVDYWDERDALPDKTVIHPGRPVGGSYVRCHESTFDVVEALAQALDQNPHSLDRAVLVVAGRQLAVGSRALRRAYGATYLRLRDSLSDARNNGTRLRFPAGVLVGRLGWLARDTLFELALDEYPIADGIDDLVKVLGLPSDLATFPPDREAIDYPSFIEVTRAGLALQVLPNEARTAARDDLDWATGCMRTVFAFAVLLARYVDLTTSPPPAISNPDPAIAASAQHVLRTLTTGGRVVARLAEAAGAGSAEYLVALAAPVLLVVLRVLPSCARTDFQGSIDHLSIQLPRLFAMVSLVEAVDVNLRRFLSFNAKERLQEATDEQRADVRWAVTSWAESHVEQVALLS